MQVRARGVLQLRWRWKWTFDVAFFLCRRHGAAECHHRSSGRRDEAPLPVPGIKSA
jgi:hypothetical protein